MAIAASSRRLASQMDGGGGAGVLTIHHFVQHDLDDEARRQLQPVPAKLLAGPSGPVPSRRAEDGPPSGEAAKLAPESFGSTSSTGAHQSGGSPAQAPPWQGFAGLASGLTHLAGGGVRNDASDDGGDDHDG